MASLSKTKSDYEDDDKDDKVAIQVMKGQGKELDEPAPANKPMVSS